VSDHHCVPGCTPEALCEGCYARDLLAKRQQAGVIGQCWAERIARRHLELRVQPAWPEHEERTLDIARRLVARLSTDPRMIDVLAVACSRGAAVWWERRPARYRG